MQEEEGSKPFDLERGPLFRAGVIRLGAEEHVLVLTMHHVVTDGWSMGIVMREFSVLYEAYAAGQESPLEEPELQYGDYAVWQREWMRGEVLEKELGYWKEALAGVKALELPWDRRRPAVPSFCGGVVGFEVGTALVERLSELGREQGATLFMVLLAGIQVLLARWSGEQDIVVGTPIAGRTHQRTEELVGFFVNMLALRTDVSGGPGFREVVKRVKEVTLSAYGHQDVPFEKVVEAAQPERDLSRQPIFQVDFTYQNMAAEGLELSGLQVKPEGIRHRSAKYDLSFLVEPSGGGLRGWIEYSTDVFERGTVERVGERLLRLLEGAVREPEKSIEELELLGEDERRLVVEEWNRTGREYPGKCVHELFEEQARRTPEAVAVEQGEERLSYGELEARSNQLARHLVSMGVGPEVVVGLCVERNVEMVVGILGILKAGGVYLPLDPSYPAERLSYMLGDAQARVIVTQTAVEDSLPAYWARVVRLDEDWAEIGKRSPEALESGANAENLAYVMYTSGSTGTPKGVGVVHRNIVRLIDPVAIHPQDVVLQLAPVTFDASTFEIWGTLLHGAKLVVAGEKSDLAELPQLIQSKGVSVLWLTAGLFHQMVDDRVAGLAGVRMLLAGGDVLSVSHVRRVLKEVEGSLVINGYGPTECTTFSTWQEVKSLGEDAATVPIGVPLANTQTYVLDERGEAAAIGVAGELYIGGAGVARGYVGRGGQTGDRFVPHPHAAGERVYRTGDLVRWNERGELEFLGRLDDQVKIRGYRIELGEIETVLREHAGVREAVVVAREDVPGEKRLVGYVVGMEGEGPASGELREYLRQQMPEYMVPSAIVSLERLPLTANGKVDRKALPAPEGRPEGMGYEAPRTPVEEALAEIWAQVLHVDRIGIRDDFFEMGGDSIRALHVQAEAQKRGYEFSLKDLFARKQIGALAEVTGVGAGRREPVAPMSLLSAGDRARVERAGYEDAYPLTLLQAGLVFHNLWDRGSATYHDVITQEVAARLEDKAFIEAVEQVVERHAILRTTIHLGEYEEPLQCVHRDMRAWVEVEDWSGLGAEEQRERLREWVKEESRREFDLARGPLVKFYGYRLGAEAFQFAISIHHAIIDGWSVAALCAEIYEEYLGRLGGESGSRRRPLGMHYRDYVAQEREALQDRAHEAYWEGVVERLEPAPLWRLEREENAGESEASETLICELRAELVQGIGEFARQAGVPVKSVLFGAHLNALRALMGGRAVQTGLVMHARPEGMDAEKVIGLFLNTVPIRFESGGGNWQELVRQAEKAEQEALAHRTYPVVEIYRRHGGKELQDVIFSYMNFHVVSALRERLRITSREGAYQTNFPMTVSVELDARGGSGGLMSISYQVGRVSRRQAEAFRELYVGSLREMVERPEEAYEGYALLPEQDARQLEEWNRTEREYPVRCVHELFEEQARRTPEAEAVVCDEQRLSYGELNRRSNQLARHLGSMGVGPDEVVGLCVERGVEMMVGILGILKAGGAYLPLDANYPAERLSYMLADAAPKVVVTQYSLRRSVPRSFRGSVICLDQDWEAIGRQSAEALESGANAENLAYVMYTSGSTGTPKGVGVVHRNIVRLIHPVSIHSQDVVLQLAPVTFDASTFEIWGALLHGAELVVSGEKADLAELPAVHPKQRSECAVADGGPVPPDGG